MKKSKLEKACGMSFEEWNEKMEENEKKERLKMLRERSGMSQRQFADYFEIPIDTLRNWEQGRRQCPEYLLNLIQYKLTKEKLIKGFDNLMEKLNQE